MFDAVFDLLKSRQSQARTRRRVQQDHMDTQNFQRVVYAKREKILY